MRGAIKRECAAIRGDRYQCQEAAQQRRSLAIVDPPHGGRAANGIDAPACGGERAKGLTRNNRSTVLDSGVLSFVIGEGYQ